MEIRKATIEDLDAITALEAACFPAAEAASRESFRKRLEIFADRFWLLWEGDRLVSMVAVIRIEVSEYTAKHRPLPEKMR